MRAKAKEPLREKQIVIKSYVCKECEYNCLLTVRSKKTGEDFPMECPYRNPIFPYKSKGNAMWDERKDKYTRKRFRVVK